MPVETFSISEEAREKLKTYCAEHRANKSRVVRDAVELFLESDGHSKNIPVLHEHVDQLVKLCIMAGLHSKSEHSETLWKAIQILIKDIKSPDGSSKETLDFYQMLYDFYYDIGGDDIDDIEDLKTLVC